MSPALLWYKSASVEKKKDYTPTRCVAMDGTGNAQQTARRAHPAGWEAQTTRRSRARVRVEFEASFDPDASLSKDSCRCCELALNLDAL
jgi:hypothetical protein